MIAALQVGWTERQAFPEEAVSEDTMATELMCDAVKVEEASVTSLCLFQYGPYASRDEGG